MYRYIRYIVLILAITLCGTELSLAQSISVQAPSKVPAGDNFRLSYTVNTQDCKKILRIESRNQTKMKDHRIHDDTNVRPCLLWIPSPVSTP